MNLLIATRNPHKLEEIHAILDLPGIDLVSALDFPELPDVIEDGATLEANAVKKAVSLALATGLWSMADDTGLEVDALNGEPGVRSARYAGEPTDYAANNRKLLQALEPHANRAARFRTVIALADPTGRAQIVEGICPGTIATAPRGTGGFGYDPLFIPDNETRCFAELTNDEKNRISHRGRALHAAATTWSDQLRALAATPPPA